MLLRSFGRITTILFMSLVLVACGTRSLGTVATVEQERELGEESLPLLIASRGGLYSDAGLRRYVQGLTDKLVATVDLPEGYEPLRIDVLDTEEPSAYAGAGGAIFVTRGLLGMVTTEAELAGVIAHEIGHVMKRHVAEGIAARERQVKDVLDTQSFRLRQAGTRNSQMSILRAELEKRLPDYTAFSRGQELEADQLALQMLTDTGYPTSGFRDLLVRVENWQTERIRAIGVSDARLAELQRRSNYPRLTDRVAALGTLREESPDPQSQARLMRAIDGMTFDNRYEGGVVQNRKYRNTRYGLGFDVPDNVLAQHGEGLRLVGTDETVILRLDKQRDRTIDDMAEVTEAGRLTFREQKRLEINGFPAMTAKIRSKRTGIRSIGRLTVIDLDTVFASFIGVSADNDAETTDSLYDDIVASVRNIPKSRVPTVRRYRTQTVEAGDTVASLAAETTFDGDKEAALRLWNGLGPDDSLEVGQWVKLVQ